MTRSQESDNGVEFFRRQVVGKRWHIAPAVDDAHRHLLWREPLAHVGEVRAAMAALPCDG